MKSREGTVVDADDLMDEMVATGSSSPEEGQKNEHRICPQKKQPEVARRVGLGSLKYFILKVDPQEHDLQPQRRALTSPGNTGSFIQYTYARIRSLLRKAEELGIAPPRPSLGFTSPPREQELIT